MGNYIVEGIFNKKERRYLITGSKLKNTIVPISGAKNSVLPVLVASILTNDKVILSNIPLELNDVQAAFEILAEVGCGVDITKETVMIRTENVKNVCIKQDVASKTRYSSLLMGALLARFGNAQVPYPGGCKLGDGRPIDIHMEGLKALGVEIELGNENILLKTKAGLVGAEFTMRYPSVGATENLLIAASLAKGVTVLKNCACEPEISDLAIFLNKAGARIKGIGTRDLTIEGVTALNGCSYCIVPDRIEVGTFIGLCTAGRSKLVLAPVIYEHIESIVEKYREMGVKITRKDDILDIDATGELKPVDIATDVYPAIPTDMQPLFSAVLASIPGKSTITDTVYKNRFAHVAEMQKMGVDIAINDQTLIVDGGKRTNGATVFSHDLRAGAALLLIAPFAHGTTEILNVQQIERGYCDISGKMRKMGVDIEVI